MSLTYQPFADAPAVQELKRDLDMNISNNERIVSGLIGAALVGLALAGGRVGKWLVAAAGIVLVQRGVRGRCEWYRQLGVDRRHVSG
jgi:uncharacterized membrane protein